MTASSRFQLISLLLVCTLFFFSTAQDKTDFYKKGEKELKSGEWAKAGDTWIKGRNFLALEGKSDPRIGFAFIELVTEHELTHFYKQASRMYLEVLTENNLKKHPKLFQEEAKRLLPLVEEYNSRTVIKEWENLIKKKSPELIANMRGLWINLDFTPVTEYNERLIEHWERIAYSRKNFTKSKRSAYKTDDRADIFIKYGKPDRERTGSHYIETRRKDGRVYRDIITYDIWAYTEMDAFDSIIYVFGANRGEPYEMKDSIEDFVPDLVSDAPFYDIYEKLMLFDPFFERRFNELAAGSGQAKTSYQMLDRDDALKYNIPIQTSEYEEVSINPISIISTLTRTLDENNDPKLCITAISYPRNIEEKYSLTHSLMIYDEMSDLEQKLTHTPSGSYDNISVFNFEHSEKKFRYVLASDAFEADANSLETNNIGKVILEPEQPLVTDILKLELSDIITGADIPENTDRDIFPFPILPSVSTTSGDPFKVYFEIYHLRMNSDAKYRYEIEYSILRKKKPGFLHDLLGHNRNREMVSRSSEYSSNQPTVKESVYFDISDLEIENYEFTITVTDLNSGQKKSRTGEFRIIN
ncbi:GWxTD domain-containing protein [candidate division KSB1 bacterium]